MKRPMSDGVSQLHLLFVGASDGSYDHRHTHSMGWHALLVPPENLRGTGGHSKLRQGDFEHSIIAEASGAASCFSPVLPEHAELCGVYECMMLVKEFMDGQGYHDVRYHPADASAKTSTGSAAICSDTRGLVEGAFSGSRNGAHRTMKTGITHEPWALVNLNCDSLDVVTYCCTGGRLYPGFQPLDYMEPFKKLFLEARMTLLHGYGISFQLRRPYSGRRSALIQHCDGYAKWARRTLNCLELRRALHQAMAESCEIIQRNKRTATLG